MPPTPRLTRIAMSAATPVAVVAAAGVVFQSSHAAFSGSTRNSGNDWSSATVSLTDDDSGAARFSASNLTPGQTETRCIRVSAKASVDGVVKGYLVNPVRTSGARLEQRIRVTIRAGSGGSFNSCNGFVASGSPLVQSVPLSLLFDSDTYEEGLDHWQVTPGTSTRTYEMTWQFDTATMTQAEVDGLQGLRTGVDFQLELRSK